VAKGDTTITVWNDKPGYAGIKRVYGTAVLDNYKTGGYTFDMTVYGLGTIRQVLVEPCLGHTCTYDYTNNKLLVYTTAATELGDDNAALAAQTLHFTAVGHGA
jgi:hypothetical protein